MTETGVVQLTVSTRPEVPSVGYDKLWIDSNRDINTIDSTGNIKKSTHSIGGKLPTFDNSSITTDLVAWNAFVPMLNDSVTEGSIFTTDVVSTYTLVYTLALAYCGGVLAPNGDIHFVPFSATKGQKINTMSARPFSMGICCSPFFNKF